jgi:4-hydroxy-tetrahydrodipicolinate reductase
MKIALLGYGKMGKTIEMIAERRGHTIVIKADKDTKPYQITDVDVAIDFSTPETAFNNIKNCIVNKVPVVSGTTGWLDSYDEMLKICKKNNGSFLYASNFSIGVNIFFKLNDYLAELISKVEGYHVSIKEIHHIHKQDAPSGTAISLAEQILRKSHYNEWKLADNSDPEKDLSGTRTIPIIAEREGEIPGIHDVMYKSEFDQINIRHLASSREGFALGAVIAAEWIMGKTGVFNMNDVLNI